MLNGRRFPLRLKGSIYKSYVRPAMLYGSEAWCLKVSEMGILLMKKLSVVWVLQLNDRKISSDLTFMLGLNETVDQLAMASSADWYFHVRKGGRSGEGH